MEFVTESTEHVASKMERGAWLEDMLGGLFSSASLSLQEAEMWKIPWTEGRTEARAATCLCHVLGSRPSGHLGGTMLPEANPVAQSKDLPLAQPNISLSITVVQSTS